MRKMTSLIILYLSTLIFSVPALAHEYENTIDHMLFSGYKEYGISVSVTTNVDTEEGAKIYLAVYNNAGVLCEVVSKPLDQKDEGESKIYRLKISSVLNNTMTVKAFVWKDMMPCAEVFSKLYNDKYDSVPVPTVPDHDDDYKIDLPEDDTTADDIKDKILDDIESNTPPNDYEFFNPELIDKIESITDELILPGRTPDYDMYLDEYGNLIRSNT